MLIALRVFNVFGNIVGGIISFVIILSMLALFSKLRYDIKVAKNGADEPVRYRAKISWFLGLFSVVAADGAPPVIKIAGFKLKMGDGDGDEADNNAIDDKFTTSTEKPNRFAPADKKAEKKAKKKAKKEKQEKTLNNLKDYWKIYETLGNDDLKAILAAAFATLKEIFKRILPKKLRVRGVIGLDEPDATGMMLAGVAAVNTLGLDVIIEGNFEEKTLEIDAHAKGKFCLYQLAKPALKLWRTDEVKKLRFLLKVKNKKYKKSKKRKGVINGNGVK